MYSCRDDMSRPTRRRKCVLNVNGTSKQINIESNSHFLASVPSKVIEVRCFSTSSCAFASDGTVRSL